MSANDKKWDEISRAITKREAEEKPDVVRSMELDPKALKSPDGILAQYKAKKIARQTGLKMMQVWYDTQLEHGKHLLREGVMLKKREIDLEAQRFLEDLNRRHIHYLNDLGVKDVQKRTEALISINETTAKSLEQVKDADWPQEMKDKTIDSIYELYSRFFLKVMQE